MLAKKKKTTKVQRRFDREKEINRQVRGGESQSDVEVELKSEEPMEMGDNTSALKDHEPTAMSVSGRRDVETRGDVPQSRKHAASEHTTLE